MAVAVVARETAIEVQIGNRNCSHVDSDDAPPALQVAARDLRIAEAGHAQRDPRVRKQRQS